MIAEYKTIDEYIGQCPADMRERLGELRETIRKSVPEAAEKISWGMPTFCLNGNLIHFFLYRNHIGLYPGAEAIEHFRERLSGYATSKGGVRLPLDKPLPKELIAGMVKYNADRARGERSG